MSNNITIKKKFELPTALHCFTEQDWHARKVWVTLDKAKTEWPEIYHWLETPEAGLLLAKELTKDVEYGGWNVTQLSNNHIRMTSVIDPKIGIKFSPVYENAVCISVRLAGALWEQHTRKLFSYSLDENIVYSVIMDSQRRTGMFADLVPTTEYGMFWVKVRSATLLNYMKALARYVDNYEEQN